MTPTTTATNPNALADVPIDVLQLAGHLAAFRSDLRRSWQVEPRPRDGVGWFKSAVRDRGSALIDYFSQPDNANIDAFRETFEPSPALMDVLGLRLFTGALALDPIARARNIIDAAVEQKRLSEADAQELYFQLDALAPEVDAVKVHGQARVFLTAHVYLSHELGYAAPLGRHLGISFRTHRQSVLRSGTAQSGFGAGLYAALRSEVSGATRAMSEQHGRVESLIKGIGPGISISPGVETPVLVAAGSS